MKNCSNQTTSSLYNAFNQLSLAHDDQLAASEQQQLSGHFGLPSSLHAKQAGLVSANLTASNLGSSVSTSSTAALLPLQLHGNSTGGQRNALESTLMAADSNGFSGGNAFHQLNAALHQQQQQAHQNSANHAPTVSSHLTNSTLNSTNSSINSSTINLANLGGLGMPASMAGNLGELYHPLEVQMYGNYANDYQLQAGITLDNLYSQQLNDGCNFDATIQSMYQQQQQQQIAMHLLNSNLANGSGGSGQANCSNQQQSI